MSVALRRTVLGCAAVGVIGGACSPDQAARGAAVARVPGYATVHDTMPEPMHHAKHAVVERPDAEISRSRSLEATASRLRRIASSRDAWLDLTLRRRVDEQLASEVDTLALLMNCNADSLVVFDARGAALTRRLVMAPGDSLHFADGTVRIRVYGLRPIKAGQRSETLVRMARGGDLVVRTPVDP